MSDKPLVRLRTWGLKSLNALHLNHVVVIAKDVSVQVVGHIESAHNKGADARIEAKRLSAIYDDPESFVVVDISNSDNFRVP